METAHKHRDLMTRDKANAVDSHRQRDSGLKGQRVWKSSWMKANLPPPPTHAEVSKGADKLKDTIDTYAPPGVQQLADIGIEGFKFGWNLRER